MYSFASGLLTSDGTEVTIPLGFIPTKIVLYNYTGTNPNVYIWTKGLASTNCFLITGSTGQITKGVTGPSVVGDTSDDTYAHGSDPVYETADDAGFSIPAALLTDADTWMWEAHR